MDNPKNPYFSKISEFKIRLSLATDLVAGKLGIFQLKLSTQPLLFFSNPENRANFPLKSPMNLGLVQMIKGYKRHLYR
jgi:hypothetical protein